MAARHLLLAILLVLSLGAAGQTSKTAPKAQPSKPKPAAPTKAQAPGKKAVPAKKAVSKSAAKKTSKKRAAPRKRIQQQPAPERYVEIQEALIGRGLLQGPATGAWGSDSVTALKSFQESQKLNATGKIDSLTLIRLGLGPNRTAGPQGGGVPPSPPPKEANP